MSVTLRHKKFPLVVVYNDPQEGWDKFVEKMVLEELKENGFRDYVIVIEEHDEQRNTKEDL